MIVRHGRADDHQTPDDRRRRGDAVLPVILWLVSQTGREIHNTFVAEVRAGRAGLPVERDESGIDRRHEDSRRASLAGAGAPPGPCGDPTIGEITVVAAQLHGACEPPPFGARHRIERDHAAERRR